MLERENFNNTTLIDYGFAIVHFIDSMREHAPSWIFSRFELMDSAKLGSFKAHAEYFFIDGVNTVHRCDVFGSEQVMSSQPQAISEEIERMNLHEVTGEIKIDRSSGDIFLRFMPDDINNREYIDESVAHWKSALHSLPPNMGTLTRCQVESLCYLDLAIDHIHYVGVVPQKDMHRLEPLLLTKTHENINHVDMTEPFQWLFHVLPTCEFGNS